MAKKKIDNHSITYPSSLKEHSFYKFKLDPEQTFFRDCIWDENTLIISCNAKSGTGKTTIATATAHLLVEYGRYDGIIYIVSPYAEKEQGYLPGGLVEKSEPYFQPFYQALEEIRWPRSSSCYNIECYTHTFLRGVNFQNKVVILDETQNFTTESLKKVLTRIHDNCKVIVIGHRGQIDLDNKEDSGFNHYIDYYQQMNDERVKICSLSTNHRGWLSTTADSIPKF